MLAASKTSEIASLEELSARIGADPMLTQAGTGNTSVKLDGTLWVKASGKWLANARQEDLFVPVNLAEARASLQQGCDIGGEYVNRDGERLTPSIETAMHAVLPHRVVIHVHSINTIAWAVREDGPEGLASRLGGLAWQWVPYVPSGRPLAREIESALHGFPGANIFVLANHGLVVCEDCPESAEELLYEVDQRLALAPRPAPAPDYDRLFEAASADWHLPVQQELHCLGTDSVSRRVVEDGTLYPCQAMFLSDSGVFRTVERCGILVRSRITDTEYAMLEGLAQVAQRISDCAPVTYLPEAEVTRILNTDARRYRAGIDCN